MQSSIFKSNNNAKILAIKKNEDKDISERNLSLFPQQLNGTKQNPQDHHSHMLFYQSCPLYLLQHSFPIQKYKTIRFVNAKKSTCI